MSILQIISLGNDIVDLNDPDTIDLFENKKFLNKVYCESELNIILKLAVHQRHIYLWKLWAAKEAAYKAVKRLRKDAIFSPRLFQVSDDLTRVNHQGRSLHLEFCENNCYLHAAVYIFFESNEPVSSDLIKAAKSNVQCWISNYDDIYNIIKDKNIPMISSYSQESSLTKMFATIQIAEYLNINQVRLEKESDSRSAIPEVWLNNTKTNHLISMSHHGRFCSVLFCLSNRQKQVTSQKTGS